jgi:TolB protein
LVAAAWWFVVAKTAGPIPPFTELHRLTSLPGLESDPTWAPDGRTIVYTSSQGGYLGLWMRQIDGGQALHIGLEGVDEDQAAYSPDGSSIAFVSARNNGGRLEVFRGGREMESYAYGGNGDLFVMPGLGGTAVKVADDAYDPSWSPDGQRIAFRSARNGNWRLYTVRVSDRVVEMVGGVEPRVVGISWSPDGQWIAYTAGESTASGWDLYVVPATGGLPVQLTFDSATVALRPSWSPAGNWIAFSSTRGGPLNLWGVPFESDPPSLTGSPKRLTTGIGEDVGVAVAPDGAAVAYAGLHTAPDVWMLDTASGALTQLTSETTTEDYPRVSPDGTRLLFFSNRSGEEQLWMQDLATGELQQVSRGNARQSAWSPDGNRVTYGTEQGLFIQDLSTGEVTVVGPHLLASSPVFSPDGREVAFHGRDQRPPGDVYFPVRRSQLYRVEVEDASTLRLLPTPEGDPSDLTWSADGQTIFFGVDLPGGVSLWAVDLATAAFRQIPTQLTDVRHATVSPDGTLILFVHEHRDLYVMPTSGGIPRLLHASTELNRTIDFPSWTNDGRVVFSVRDKSGDLFLLRAEGR